MYLHEINSKGSTFKFPVLKRLQLPLSTIDVRDKDLVQGPPYLLEHTIKSLGATMLTFLIFWIEYAKK